jgi:hypothetical protein
MHFVQSLIHAKAMQCKSTITSSIVQEQQLPVLTVHQCACLYEVQVECSTETLAPLFPTRVDSSFRPRTAKDRYG